DHVSGLRAGATEPSVLIPFRATGGGVSAGLEGAKASVLSFGQLATCAAIPGSMSLFSMAAVKLFTAAELRRCPGSMFWGLLFYVGAGHRSSTAAVSMQRI